ncbi:hypothetical protein TRVA0_008S02256 [Trichomonascus vanleenenianus]|uniref:exoribonuclease II n=1 Tax=Trichomonascus vanleenenianus TaxID=2268995 RepID=UPI003ECB837C
MRALRPYRIRPRWARCAIRRRWATTEARPVPPQAPVDQYADPERPKLLFKEIAADMDSRRALYDVETFVEPDHLAANFPHLVPDHLVSYLDFNSGLRVGDLVESSRRGLCVIVEAPGESNGDKVGLCNLFGGLNYVQRRDVTIRLGSVADPKLFDNCIRKLTIDDNTETVVAPQVRNAVLKQLRQFHTHAFKHTRAVRFALSEIAKSLRKRNRAVNVPLYELAYKVQQYIFSSAAETSTDIMSSSFPPPETSAPPMRASVLYLVYKLIERVHYNSMLLNSESGYNTVTLLSLNDVEAAETAVTNISFPEVLEATEELMQTKKGEWNSQVDSVVRLSKRYALDDIGRIDNVAQSGAISLLRSMSKYAPEIIEQGTALDFQKQIGNLNKTHGPFFDKFQYNFIKELREPPALSFNGFDRENYPDVIYKREEINTPVYCIDDPSAKEIDDGISIDTADPRRWRVGVHIADPVSALRDGRFLGLLDRAYKLSSTVYLPSGSIPMLPKSFTDSFGLVENVGPRRCLSLMFNYYPETQNVDPTSIRPYFNMISNIRQISYTKVTEMLQQPPDASEDHRNLHNIYKVAQSERRLRESKNALKLTLNSASVSVEFPDCADEEILLTAQVETPATVLVSELMILANSMTAYYTRKNSIPSIYRNQNLHFAASIDSLKGLNDYQVVQHLNSACLSTVPAPHVSLAAPLYCHTTSPLRRFQDLIVHWQLQAHSTRNRLPALSRTQVAAAATRLHTTQQLIQKAQKQSIRYWTLRKIEKEAKPGMAFQCVITKPPQFELFSTNSGLCTDYGVNGELILPRHDAFKVGTKIKCSLVSVDAITSKLVLKFEDLNE